jgi:glycerol-3-phosphate dehydrogenase
LPPCTALLVSGHPIEEDAPRSTGGAVLSESQIECVVVGAGVVGLAVARALALDGHEVLVLEKERWIGSETSSRNSEVIHAGLYYPQGRLP